MNLNDTFEIKLEDAADVVHPAIDTTNILDSELTYPIISDAEKNLTTSRFSNSSLASVVDGTKTLTISKNRTRPNLPEAITEQYHDPYSTFSDKDSHISSDVEVIINAVKERAPVGNEKGTRMVIAQEVFSYLLQKALRHRKEVKKVRMHSEALRIANLESNNDPKPVLQSEDIEGNIAEVDNLKKMLRNKHVENLRSVSDYAQKAEKFVELEIVSSLDDKEYNKSASYIEKICLEVKDQYRSLLKEGMDKCDLINKEVERLNNEHSELINKVNNEIELADFAIKQHEQRINDLTKQKSELLEMVDPLVDVNKEDANSFDS